MQSMIKILGTEALCDSSYEIGLEFEVISCIKVLVHEKLGKYYEIMLLSIITCPQKFQHVILSETLDINRS
jgi:hypothetical protein